MVLSMKAAVIIKRDAPQALECAGRVASTLRACNIVPVFDRCYERIGMLDGEFLPASEMVLAADVVIAVGGDGTILHAAKQAAIQHKPALGINSGTVGFMAGLEPNELYRLSGLIDGRYEIDFADVEEKIVSSGVRLYLLCSPHNPVGRVWTREELKNWGISV